jgi:hypothetical protein
MGEKGLAAEKLQAIEQLWKDIRRMKPGSLEYLLLTKKIRHLSEEYEALMAVSKKPK